MNTNETPTPRTEYARQYDAVAGQWSVPADFARTLERELECMRSAFDKQCSVTLGQMQTIRDLRAELSVANERAEKAEALINSITARELAVENAAHSLFPTLLAGAPSLDELIKRASRERDDLRRAIAAKDAVLLEFHRQADGDGFCWTDNKCIACRALSPDAGKGWLSPAEVELLKEQIRVADVAFNGLNERHNKATASIAAKDAALKIMVDWFGGPHSDDCQEDDTCQCVAVKQVNAALVSKEGGK